MLFSVGLKGAFALNCSVQFPRCVSTAHRPASRSAGQMKGMGKMTEKKGGREKKPAGRELSPILLNQISAQVAKTEFTLARQHESHLEGSLKRWRSKPFQRRVLPPGKR